MHPPSVDKLARSITDTDLPHPVLVDVAREAIADGDHENFAARVTDAGHGGYQSQRVANVMLSEPSSRRFASPYQCTTTFHMLSR